MKRAISLLVALVVAISAMWSAAAIAQTQRPQPPGPAAPGPGAPGATPGAEKGAEKGAMKEVEGKIKSVEPSGGTTKVLLEDGTQLMLPASVKFDRASLKQGATVKAGYEEKGGQKIVSAIQVQPASKGAAPGPAGEKPGKP